MKKKLKTSFNLNNSCCIINRRTFKTIVYISGICVELLEINERVIVSSIVFA